MLIVSLLKVWTQFEKNKHVGYKTPKSSKNNIFASSYPPQQFIIIMGFLISNGKYYFRRVLTEVTSVVGSLKPT